MKTKILLILLICCLGSVSAVTGGAEETTAVKTDGAGMQPSPDQLKEKWGIEVLNIRISAEGYMLDFRYKVLDPKKAAPLFDRTNKPVLTHEKTGAKFIVPVPPKVGSLRQTRPPVGGKNYFMIFANPGKYVKQGDKVTVTAGDFSVSGLTVE